MNFMDRAKADIERFTSNGNEFGASLLFNAPTFETASINGLHTKHHLGIDTDGNMVNSKHVHVSFSERLLIAVNYPVRNLKGEVDLKNHKVSVVDSTGSVKNYKVQKWFPDETIGLITCILEDYA